MRVLVIDDDPEMAQAISLCFETRWPRTETLSAFDGKSGVSLAEKKGPEFYRRIGRKGGEKVAEERGSEFYRRIGKKGGEKVSEEKGPEFIDLKPELLKESYE